MHFDSELIRILFYILASVSAIVLLVIGYKIGRWIGDVSARKHITMREQEMFTSQRGVKNLYEQDLVAARAQIEHLQQQVNELTHRVEEYRKKAAGFGGLFGGGKRAEAMYALLLENEALEEALLGQNQKLSQERMDALKEQMRSTGYRRVLMSQLMRDDRIRGYVNEVLSDEKRLPDPNQPPESPRGQT